jgi:DNA-binding transcriptional ArsR family regulator
MKSVNLKERAYPAIANIAKALGHPHRLELLELIGQGPKSVDQLAKEARMSFANTSQHLQRLKQLNLVKTKRDFTTIYYTIADQSIITLIKALHQTAFNRSLDFKDVLSLHNSESNVTSISLDELEGVDYVLLDVRNKSEFAFGHKKDAVNIPHTLLKQALDQLDKNKLIVAYCRGELCSYADDVVTELTNSGFKAARLKEIIMTKTA